MSMPLKDFRGAIDESTDMWLDIEAQAQGLEKQAIVRQVLREWTKKKTHAYKIATKRLQSNGLQPELFGDDPEDAGTPRSVKR